MGFCQGCICINPDELTEASKQNLAYNEVRHAIQDIKYPVAFLNYVEVEPEYRRRGLASKAVTEFEAFAQSHAATMIILKAAYDDDAESEWKSQLYCKLGFVGFAPEHPAFPVMFKNLCR